ncbi:MAG TPA: ParA family protein [Pirellulales bacterium]
MRSVAIYNAKGGVGKSAVTVFLAEFLAAELRARVLVVDLDPRQSSSAALLGDARLFAGLQQKASLDQLLRRRLQGPLDLAETRRYLLTRPAASGKGDHRWLGAMTVLAADREAWHDLSEDLIRLRRGDSHPYDELLTDALAPLSSEFDVALIDFPAHDRGPLVRAGLRASGWWLLPLLPDRVSLRDLDSSRQLLRAVSVGAATRIRPLGTLPTLCPPRRGGAYLTAKATLARLAEQRLIPKLFPVEAEIPFGSEAKNGLDDVLLDRCRTLSHRLGARDGALHQAVSRLGREVVARLKTAAISATLASGPSINEAAAALWATESS